MRHLLVLLIFFISVFPVCAIAQESTSDQLADVAYTIINSRTKQDNFAGLQLGGVAFLGSAPIEEYNAYGGAHYPPGEVRKKIWYPAFGILMSASYLWGETLFIGPELNLTFGFPFRYGADLRVKGALPMTASDAMTLNFGLGFDANGLAQTEYTEMRILEGTPVPSDNDLDDFIRSIYLPVAIGYDHVFDNGFVLGVLLEMRVAFKVKETHYYYMDNEQDDLTQARWDDNVKKDGVVPMLDAVLAGVHLGYKF